MPVICAWLPTLPANARAGLVLLKRPCTFVAALVWGALGVLAALFYSATGLEPPSCPCDSTPRTRPRPVQPAAVRPSSPSAAAAPKPQSTLQSLQSLVTAPFRASPSFSARPPPARRHSTRKIGAFAVHELDGVLEAREEEDDDDDEGGAPVAPEARVQDRQRTPSLTRDGSGSSDDAVSEADTLVDPEVVEDAAGVRAGAKGKGGLTILTHSLRWMKSPSTTKKDVAAIAVVESPDGYTSPGSSSSPIASASASSTSASSTSASSRKGPCPVKALRNRACTVSQLPHRPSPRITPGPRRVTSEGKDYFAHSPDSPTTAPSDDSAAPSPVYLGPPSPADLHARLAAPKPRKRAATSLFFRSLSPLSRSPATTPEPSPPPSPRIPAGASATSAAGMQRIFPKRTSSIDSEPSTSSTARNRRGRSPVPEHAPPLASRPSSDASVDLRGSSGLALSDVLSRSFRM
ncbi:hypothetical protein JCM3770_002544 [Rhodotorula araucariae]